MRTPHDSFIDGVLSVGAPMSGISEIVNALEKVSSDLTASSQATLQERVDSVFLNYLDEVADYVSGALESNGTHTVRVVSKSGSRILMAEPASQTDMFSTPAVKRPPYTLTLTWEARRSSKILWRYLAKGSRFGADISMNVSDMSPKMAGDEIVENVSNHWSQV